MILNFFTVYSPKNQNLTKCKANNNQNNKMSFSPADRGIFLLNTGKSSSVAGQGLSDGIVATSAVEFESHFEETD